MRLTLSERKNCRSIARLVLLPLLLCLALLLGACGELDGAEGEYLCVALSLDGSSFSADYLFSAAPRLILSAGGRGKLSVNGETGTIHWQRSGSSLRVTAVERSLTGTIADGVAELTLSDTGILATFVREDLAEAYEADAAHALAEAWRGDWYGWWEVRNSEGTLPDTWYDCCASIEVLTDGSARMLLWDEQSSRDEPMGLVLLRLEEGRAVVTGGRFWFQELGEDAWTLNWSDDPYESTVTMDGAEHEGEGERFTYRLCLRPWGQSWEDLRAAGERIPYFYDIWALPLIEQGASMPDRMDSRS